MREEIKMKNTILSYNQREALKLGLSTDDLVFLDWFVHFKNSELWKKGMSQK